jgi:FtsP/CotA-like multicopper oxidase with cupredoxin domain
VRLRLINAAVGRGFSLKLAGLVPWVAAIDGQGVDPFLPHEGRIGLVPGGRIDVLVDMRGDTSAALLLAGVRDEYPVARFVQDGVGGPIKPKRQPQPAALPSNPLSARIDLKNALKAELNLDDAVQGDLPRAPPVWRQPWAFSEPRDTQHRGPPPLAASARASFPPARPAR